MLAIQPNFTFLALAVIFTALCLVNSQATPSAESINSLGELLAAEKEMNDADLGDLYLENEEQIYDQQQEDEPEVGSPSLKRALPKLRRIFIGKRGMDTEDLASPDLYWHSEKKAHPRRHLFIGKRSERQKKGRIHRIFIG